MAKYIYPYENRMETLLGVILYERLNLVQEKLIGGGGANLTADTR